MVKNKYKITFCLSIFLILISSCGNQASFGEGDTKFSVDLIEGNYIVSPRGNDMISEGNLKLKICNNGQKELPFVLTEDIGGIFIEFKSEDIKNVNKAWLQWAEKIPITSDEGFINIIPGNCPTYSFSFSEAIGASDDPDNKYGMVTKEAFYNAKYYFFLGENKFELSAKG